MSSFQELRKRRLSNDYQAMVKIRKNGLIEWRPLSGTGTHIDKYELTVYVRSVIGIDGNRPLYQNKHTFHISLAADYPKTAPTIRTVSGHRIFHPNWYTDGYWCYGTWRISEGLAEYIIRMIKTLQYDKDITNENSAANTVANRWYLANKNSGLFPCDRTQLPDPFPSRIVLGKPTIVLGRKS